MWSFYFDEIFHDRKITQTKDDKINIYSEYTYDVYTGFFFGINEAEQQNVIKKFNEFENRYKKLFCVPINEEFKSTVIHKKNFNKGFRTFNKNTIDFYKDLFDLLDNELAAFHICMFSKTEQIVSEFVKNLKFPVYMSLHKSSFVYSLTKFLLNYRNEKMIKKMNKTILCYKIFKVI